MKNNLTVPVLMYHHVSPSAGMITSSPQNFASQIEWLFRNGYHALSTAEFAGHLRGETVPERSVLITFDDGYLDNWVYAYPILRKYGYQATLFIVTSWVGEGPARAYAGQGTVPITPNHKDCKRLVSEGRTDDAILRWSEIEAMRSDGTFEFHSHTHTHTRWDLETKTVAEKRERIAIEFADSRLTLQQRLGEVSDHLCWPQGYFDSDYIELAKASGFNHFYTTDAYGQNRQGTDSQHIYRFAVRNRRGTTLGRRTRLAAHPILGPWYNDWKAWKRARRQSK